MGRVDLAEGRLQTLSEPLSIERREHMSTGTTAEFGTKGSVVDEPAERCSKRRHVA